MKYPKILSQIESMRWAITTRGLQSIWDIAAKHSVADYEVFHRAPESEKQAISANMGEPLGDSQNAFVKGDTGILMFDGPIVPRADAFTQASGLISLDTMTDDFKTLDADPNIKRIVGLFDSPGGDVTGVSEFAQMVAGASTDTVSYTYGCACSAAFWIASSFGSVVGSDTGIFGSIGTVAAFRQNKDDDKIEIVSDQSPDKRPDMTTEDGRANIQQVLNELTDVFVGAVASNMGVTTKKVLSDFGQGGELVAARALSVGMIDQISTLDALMSSFSQPTPAMGGEQRRVTMTLMEFLAANPTATAELKAKLTAEFERGKVEAHSAIAADMKVAEKYLGSAYPMKVQKRAIQVAMGNRTTESLEDYVSLYDEMHEEKNSDAAVEESDETGSTASVTPLTDMQRELQEDNEIRASLGKPPLRMEA